MNLCTIFRIKLKLFSIALSYLNNNRSWVLLFKESTLFICDLVDTIDSSFFSFFGSKSSLSNEILLITLDFCKDLFLCLAESAGILFRKIFELIVKNLRISGIGTFLGHLWTLRQTYRLVIIIVGIISIIIADNFCNIDYSCIFCFVCLFCDTRLLDNIVETDCIIWSESISIVNVKCSHGLILLHSLKIV